VWGGSPCWAVHLHCALQAQLWALVCSERAAGVELRVEATRATVWRTSADDGVKRRAAPRQLEAIRATASHMVADGGVKRRAVPSQLKAPRTTAWRMVEADGVRRRAAPRQLAQEARRIARPMVEADVADRRTAST